MGTTATAWPWAADMPEAAAAPHCRCIRAEIGATNGEGWSELSEGGDRLRIGAALPHRDLSEQ